MKIRQSFATTPVIGTFAVIAISGILLFLHIKNKPLELIHTYIGLAFVLFAVLHMAANFGGLKRYFRGNKILLNLAICVVSITAFLGLTFMPNQNNDKISKPQLNELYSKISNLKIAEIAQILNTNDTNLVKLENFKNLTVKEAKKSGKISEKELINLILNQ